MGSCLHNASRIGDGLDIDDTQYEKTNVSTPSHEKHKNTNLHEINNDTLSPLNTPNITIPTKNLMNINKHQSLYSNSSGSSSSILPDEMTPHMQTVPSQSHTHTYTPTDKKTPNSSDKTGKSLEIITDMDEFPDNHEINDKHHITHESHSDEALETMRNNQNKNNQNISNDNILDDNNNDNDENEINGKSEYESDDTKVENDSNNCESINTDDSDGSEDEDEEEEPLPKDDNFQIIMSNDFNNENHIDTDDKMDIEQLSYITYKCIQSASATQAGTSKGKPKTNQDSFISIDSFGPSQLFQLYGVCDGHGPSGNNVSKYVTDNLPPIINNLLSTNTNSLSIQSILTQAFAQVESQLSELQTQNKLSFDINYSGTTATIGLIAGNKLYVANIGDSRTVLGKIPPNNKSVPLAVALSHDHDPKNATEMIRIKQTKSAKILFDDENDARIQIEIPEMIQTQNLLSIDNYLPSPDNKPKARTKHRRTQSQVKKITASVSRSIGDKIAHTYGGLISEPEIIVHNLSDKDIFVIFASDGIWQMIDNDDVMRTVGTKFNQNKDKLIYQDLQKTTSKLVREANISWLDEYEDYTDDITCVIVRIGKIE